ncbi:MAG TPA: flagellin, partial [Negativicutes bacterium]|nr:flagellin [Negativicutes bacterium]
TGKSLEKLSSGLRINRAGDDAAGLSISEKMRAQIKGLDMASKNAQDGISLIQTAEGALNETHSMLQRMRELAVQSINDTNTNVDRTALQNEVTQLRTEITRIATTTEFNSKKLINGSVSGAANALVFQIGANAGQTMSVNIANMQASTLGLNINRVSISARATAANSVAFISNAIQAVSDARSKLGAVQNRLEHTVNNLGTTSENLQAAESRIRDVDMAKEMMNFTKLSILQQSATAMLAQANQQPQGVLQLLK